MWWLLCLQLRCWHTRHLAALKRFVNKCAKIVEAVKTADFAHLADPMKAVGVAVVAKAVQATVDMDTLGSLTCVLGAHPVCYVAMRVELFESFLLSLPSSYRHTFTSISAFLCANSQATLQLMKRMATHCPDVGFLVPATCQHLPQGKCPHFLLWPSLCLGGCPSNLPPSWRGSGLPFCRTSAACCWTWSRW